MTLHEQLKNEMKATLKEKNALKLGAIRGLLAASTNEAVSKGYKPDQMLTDEETLVVIKRAAKQRKDAIAQFRAGGRDDLVENEEKELALIETYLPPMMSREEIKLVVEKIIAATGATKADLGKVIGAGMKELHGQARLTGRQADGAEVKAVVEELLK